METLKGRLLVANGNLFDPNFRQTVILIVDHGDDGALGLVLNRPAETAVARAVPALASAVMPDDPLFLGGPVQPDAAVILAEFVEGAGGDRLVADIAVMSGEVDDLAGVARARVYAGYAGWGPGQLERELEESSWIVTDALPNDIFTVRPKRLWADMLRRLGGDYRMMASMPFDPSQN